MSLALATRRAAVLGAPFRPWRLPGCATWFEVDTLGVADNTNIATMRDLSGHGADLVQATASKQPLFHASGGPSGLAYVTTDGLEDLMTAPIELNSADISGFAIFNRTASNKGAVWCDDHATTPYKSFWFGLDTADPNSLVSLYKGDGTSNDSLQGATVVAAAAWIVAGFTIDAVGAAKLFLNGHIDGTGGTNKQVLWQVQLGGAGYRPLAGGIRAGGLFSRKLSDAEAFRVSQYLGALAGIAIAP